MAEFGLAVVVADQPLRENHEERMHAIHAKRQSTEIGKPFGAELCHDRLYREKAENGIGYGRYPEADRKGLASLGGGQSGLAQKKQCSDQRADRERCCGEPKLVSPD